MIVSENNVETALRYLSADPHPIAIARYKMTKCENATKELHAQLYLMAEGTVGERESQVEVHPKYQEAKAAEAEALMELERHKSRVKAADALVDVWRSENANIRAAEKVR